MVMTILYALALLGGTHDGTDVPVDPGPPVGFVAPREAAGEAHTLFLAMDGVTMEGGTLHDDATINATSLPDHGGEWPPFGDPPGGAVRQAVIDAVRSHYARYGGLQVTDERPSEGLYTMVVVGPRNIGAQLGKATISCGGWNRAGVGFAYYSASGDPGKVASTISHEAGHTFGLEHIDDTAGLMYPTYQGSDAVFQDGCRAIADGMIGYCVAEHEAFCAAGQQNANEELALLFGGGGADVEAPTVEIVAPVDGDRFEIGVAVDVTVDADDDLGLMQVKLYAGEKLVGTKVGQPFTWTLDELDEGTYDLVAIALDDAGNETESTPVLFAVGDAPLPDDAGDEDGGGNDDGDGEPSATGIELTGPEDGGGREEGCGCSHGGRQGLGGLALWMLAGLLARRRRSVK